MNRNLHALLIGIDHYLPASTEPNLYSNLGGAVSDVARMEAFLHERAGLNSQHLICLTASNGGDGPLEPPDRRPTYENMVAAFGELWARAGAGDPVCIYYSGHGGRVPTRFPELKGENARDETLVPWNIGDPAARYLLDVELHFLLHALVDKGALVTLILDCCHAGGASRMGLMARGGEGVDGISRPQGSLVAARQELVEAWHRQARAAVETGPGVARLPQHPGAVVLAACRSTEMAYEMKLGDAERGGVFTHFFLEALAGSLPWPTYRQLHRLIVARIHARNGRQTPVLLGEVNRRVFGAEEVATPLSAHVIRRDERDGRILLAAGQVHDIGLGARFAVYPPGADSYEPEQRIAVLRTLEVGSSLSWAEVVEVLREVPIESGAAALLLAPGEHRFLGTVRLLSSNTDSLEGEALQRIADLLRARDTGFLLPLEQGDADFTVAVQPAGDYVLLKGGRKPIANLRPALRIDDPWAAEMLVARLAHLTRYRNVRRLRNPDSQAELREKLKVKLLGIERGYDPSRLPAPFPFAESGRVPVLEVGEWTFLRIRNKSSRCLHVALLNLGPDWAVSQLFPGRREELAHPLDSGEEIVLPLRAELPAGYDEGLSVLKVFATTGEVNLRWLELPKLDHPLRSTPSMPWPSDPLEQLLVAAVIHSPDRALRVPSGRSQHEWICRQRSVKIRRGKA